MSEAWDDYPPPEGEHTVAGTVRVLRQVESPELGNRRDVYAYLPPSYGAVPERRYPVLYMHDGQNLFDAATSFSGEWGVDEVMEELSRGGVEAIVIGIPNMGPERLEEYSPFTDPAHGGGEGEAYLEFVVRTLKPTVDRTLRTRPQRPDTVVAGSSMGGLISLYAFFRHRDTFGAAGALSPALWFAERALLEFLRSVPRLPGRLYLDVGTKEGAEALRDAREARDLLAAGGYGDDSLRYVEEPGAAHDEAAWGRRLRGAIPFLLGRGELPPRTPSPG